MPAPEAVLLVLERVFGQKPPADLSQPRSEVAGWTSLAHLNMIVELEEVFDITLEVEEIERMDSVQGILDVLDAKIEG
jgi:acyl carrier protein